jgi:uncharacterized phage protein (TIGR02218 family)
MSVYSELFLFAEDATITALTSGDVPFTHMGDTYVPHAIGRSEYSNKQELSKASIEILFPASSPIAKEWINRDLHNRLSLTIFAKEDSTVSSIWKGRMSSIRPSSEEIVLTFESVFTSLRRTGISKRYQRLCPLVLYGKQCGVNAATYQVNATCTARQPSTYQYEIPIAASQPNGYYSGGILEASNGDKRFIVKHEGIYIFVNRLLGALETATLPASVKIYPGCDRSKETCKNKFNNLNNYGGFPFIPGKNPFNGSII